MAKTVHIVCSATVLLLLSGCGEQLASNAQKAAGQIAAEATRAAARKLDEFKDIAREELKSMRGEGSSGKADDKPEAKPRGAANSKARPGFTGMFGPKKAAAKLVWA